MISYSRDILAHTNLWSTEAALIAPFSWQSSHTLREEDSLTFVRYGIIPSISLDRVSGGSGTQGQIDQLTYRAGLFAKFEAGHGWLSALTARAFGTYLTDTSFKSSVPAGELEVEPQILFHPLFKIGYRTIIIPKENDQDIHDTAWLAYQLRFLLDSEYGSVIARGNQPDLKKGGFFRLGPNIQLDFKPFFHPRLNLSYRYSFLPALWGSNPNNSLFNVDAEWVLFKDEDLRRKFSLKVSYLNGGLPHRATRSNSTSRSRIYFLKDLIQKHGLKVSLLGDQMFLLAVNARSFSF